MIISQLVLGQLWVSRILNSQAWITLGGSRDYNWLREEQRLRKGNRVTWQKYFPFLNIMEAIFRGNVYGNNIGKFVL